MSNPGVEAKNRADAAFSKRAEWDGSWQTIANYVLPRRAFFTEKSRSGDTMRERAVLDSTAPRALELFAAFLHSSLSSPGRDWLHVTASYNADVMARHEVKTWADDTKDKMKYALSVGRANTYTALHECYIDIGAFGTGCGFVDEHTPRSGKIRVRNYPLTQVAIEAGADGSVDVVFMRETLTHRQAQRKWPNGSLPDRVKNARADQLAAEECYTHAVFPVTDDMAAIVPPEVRELAGPSSYLAVWLMEDGTIVSSGHYEEMPYMVPRWYRASGDVYGRGPGLTALGDIIMVNRMAETVLRGAEKLVDPPWVIPDGAMLSPVRMFPGGITYSDGDIQPHPLIPPGASRIEVGEALLEKRQEAIREAFFVPLFVTPETPVKTATQVLQEVDERNRATAPMIVRLQSELMSPFVQRVYGLLRRAGVVAPPPVQPGDGEIRIDFVSPVLAAQDAQEAMAVMRWFESLAPWAGVDPAVFDHVETERVPEVLHKGAAVPASLLASPGAVKRRAEARQAREQAEAQQQRSLMGAEVQAKLNASRKV